MGVASSYIQHADFPSGSRIAAKEHSIAAFGSAEDVHGRYAGHGRDGAHWPTGHL